MTGARVFVTLVFAALAAVFLGSFGLLVYEFRNHDWALLALAHSHLFIFFPVFALLAMTAFHLPASVFVHLYWTHVPYGRLRFLHGFAWAVVISWGVSTFLLGEQPNAPRHFWELSPRAHDADRGANVPCADGRSTCQRVPALEALRTLRAESQTDIPLAKFARSCVAARLVEPPLDYDKPRWCFPAGRKLGAPDCCKVQEALREHVSAEFQRGTPRSDLSRAYHWIQPVKVFLIVVIMVLGVLLLIWRKTITELYPDLSTRLDWHIMVGSATLLLWPIMDYAYQDAANVLYGRHTYGMQLRLSLVVAPWLAIIMFYFLQRFARRVEVMGQILTVAGGLLAILARDELRDLATKLTGIGMPWWMGLVLAVSLIAGFVGLLGPRRWIPAAWRG
jgi:hypothetical protein